VSDRDDVLAAAERCVAAFGGHRRDEYFATFAPDATFVFHTTSEVLPNRAAWEAEWDRLVRDHGFRVLACESSARTVHVLGDAAVFVHRVCTRQVVDGEEIVTDERETIVHRREPDGSWLGVHEHLSQMPPGESEAQAEARRERP
jgi:ketosteroid isomerase-like protein